MMILNTLFCVKYHHNGTVITINVSQFRFRTVIVHAATDRITYIICKSRLKPSNKAIYSVNSTSFPNC